MNYLRKIGNCVIYPTSILWKIFFALSRSLYLVGVKAPNTSIQYVLNEKWILILTPLAGSSSVSSALCKSDIVRHDLTKPLSVKLPAKVYILDRDFDDRMTSFYNNKVRNPTSLAIAHLLSSCPPLHWQTSPSEFVKWEISIRNDVVKDKHLYTTKQILDGFGLDENEVLKLSIDSDSEFLSKILNVDSFAKVNSTDAIADFAKPLNLPSI